MINPAGQELHWTDFSVCVSGTKYQISNRYFNGELLVNGSDGTNSYFVNKMTKAKQLVTNWWEWGSVSSGQFPIKDMTPGQLCWLAFASSNFFVTNSPALLPLEAFQQNAGSLRYDLTLSTNPPCLPLQTKWYGSNFWYLSTNDTNNRVIVPYTNGFLAGEFVVTSATNFESFEVPLSFDLSVFIPFFRGKELQNKDVALVQILRGRVSSIKLSGDIGDFRPELGARAQIADFRIPTGTNGNYLMITRLNGKWPELGDADFARALDIARLTNRAKAAPASHRLVPGVIVFVMISSLATLLFIVRKLSKRRGKT